MRNQLDETHTHDILIVDDTPANLRVVSQMLSEQGYKVRAVTSGARALAAVEASPPDLILLDIRMPEMDGYQVCARLKADPRTRDVPIIFISALDEVQDKVKAFSAGGVDYVTKPFQIEEVLARVQAHLALKDLQKQLQEANRRFERELALAGTVQASFLPKEPPHVPGWQLAVTLQPARETSGDFYDVRLMPDGKLGLVIADVVDKGAGAALFMVLSWTLIRTYAAAYPSQPELVLKATNERMLMDTDGSQFVTVFYGILDPTTGDLVYSNAGHSPPCLISARDGGTVRELTRTGVPLGILEDRTWDQEHAQLAPGDVLLLYTDGVPDAENARQQFFGKERLLTRARASLGLPAREFRDAITAEVEDFVGEAPQLDDIALVVAARDSAGSSS